MVTFKWSPPLLTRKGGNPLPGPERVGFKEGHAPERLLIPAAIRAAINRR